MYKQFIDMIEKNDRYDVWIKEHTVASYLDKVKDEVEELNQGLKRNDPSNVVEEISDVLYNVFVLAKLAQKEYGVNIDQLMGNIIQKMKRRKPYIFEEKEVTMEEALRIWKDAKIKEKEFK